MRTVQNSVVLRWLWTLCLFLYQQYEMSVIAKWCHAVAVRWNGIAKESVVLRVCLREGVLARSYPNSVLCRALSVLANLPALALRWIYQRFEGICKHSVFLQFVFAVVSDIPVMISWLICGIIVMPYEYWNNAYSLLGFAFLCLLSMLAFVKDTSQRLDVKTCGPFPVFLWASILVAYPLSSYVGLSQRFVFYHLACILCVLVIVSTVKEARQLVRLAGMATLGLCLVSAYGIVQRIQGIEVNPSFVDLTLNEGMPGRVFSVFDNPNAFGEVLVLLIPVAVGLIFASKSMLGKLLGVCGFGMGSIALVMTYSRAGWIGFAIAMFCFVFFFNRKLIPLAMLLGLAFVPFLPDVIFNRIATMFNFSDSSTASRFPLYQAVLRLLSIEPIKGAGLGSDAVRTFITDRQLYKGISPFVHGHNVYLQLWAEAGLVALLSLLASVAWTLKKAWTVMSQRQENRPEYMLMATSASALLGILVCGMADYIWHYPRVMMIFFFVFALAIAGIRLSTQEIKHKGWYS